MSLPWVRLDTSLPSNPKVLAMVTEKDGHRALAVYLCSLAYAGAQGTDGFIPREALPFIHGRDADAKRLHEHGFWIEQPGGWLIHGWTEKQLTSEEHEQRRIKAQAAAQARWSKQRTGVQA